MSRRTERLCRELGLDKSVLPLPETAGVQARVNKALNTEPEGRRGQTRRLWRTVAVLAVAAALVVGTALAVGSSALLGRYFGGNLSAMEGNVLRPALSVSDENWTLTADEVLSDPYLTLATFTVEAHSDDARDKLKQEFFAMDHIRISGGSTSAGSIFKIESELDGKAQFMLQFSTVAVVTELGISIDEMEQQLSVPLSAVDVVDLSMEQPAHMLQNDTCVVTRVMVSPISLRVEVSLPADKAVNSLYVPVFFRMQDGAIKTLTQLTEGRHDSQIEESDTALRYAISRKFTDVLDLSQVEGVIVGNREYALEEPGDTKPASVEAALYPFEIEGLELEDGDLGLPLRRICEKLGADYHYDPETERAEISYRGKTVTLASTYRAPIEQDGELFFFCDYIVLERSLNIDIAVSYGVLHTMDLPDKATWFVFP